MLHFISTSSTLPSTYYNREPAFRAHFKCRVTSSQKRIGAEPSEPGDPGGALTPPDQLTFFQLGQEGALCFEWGFTRTIAGNQDVAMK